jgi:hypothetical protein
MATSTYLSNPIVSIGAVDISDQCTNANLSQKIMALPDNAFGSTATSFTAGLQDNTLTLELYWSTAATETYATFKALVGTKIASVTIKGSSAATGPTNPLGTLANSYLEELPVVYSLGELSRCTIVLRGGTFAWTEV